MKKQALIRKIQKKNNKTQKSPLAGGFFKVRFIVFFWVFFGLGFLMPTLQSAAVNVSWDLNI